MRQKPKRCLPRGFKLQDWKTATDEIRSQNRRDAKRLFLFATFFAEALAVAILPLPPALAFDLKASIFFEGEHLLDLGQRVGLVLVRNADMAWRKQISAEDMFPEDISLAECEAPIRRLAEKVWMASKCNGVRPRRWC